MSAVKEAFKILEDVSNAKGKDKQRILQAVTSEPVLSILKDYFYYALDSFVTFGVVVEKFPKQSTRIDSSLWWTELKTILRQLSDRNITGNAARSLLEGHLSKGEDDVVKWTLPMVNKNITIGVSNATINKIWPGLLRDFSCQLADEFAGKIPEGGGLCERKFDGLRGIFVLDPTNPQVLSRNGKVLNNVGHIIKELMPVFRGQVVDGELFAKDWSSSVGAVRSLEKGDTSSRFRVFDLLSMGEFLNKKCNNILINRQNQLDEMLKSTKAKYTLFMPGEHAASVEDVVRITQKYVDEGFEGGVLKDPQSLYSYDRSRDWLKVKKFQSVDAKVVDLEEGTGRNKGRLGAIVIEAPGISRSKVGSGFSDVDRVVVWENRGSYLGEIVEVQFFEKTPDACLRFPTFLRWRCDRD